MTLSQGSAVPSAESQAEFDLRQPAPIWHSGIWFLFYTAGMLLEVWSAGVIRKPRSSNSSHLVFLCLVQVAASFVILFYIWWGLWRNRFPLAELIGLRWKRGHNILLAIGVVAGNWILVYALYFVFGEFKLRPSSLFSAPQNVTEFIALALVLGGAGFFEEIEYRGYILRQVLSLTGSKSFAIAVQAVLFAVAHGLDQTLVGLTAKFAFGWVLGEVAIRRRSLLPGMLAHSMNNLLALLLRVLL